MKFFHTADWHLGKLVQGVYMTEDQRFVLRQFVDAVKLEKPDAVVIAGDLYDRAVPPTEAVALLDDVLAEIVMDLKTPVLAIGGNHDSPGRLHFGSGLMRDNGYHIVGQLNDIMNPVILNDEFGEVHFHLIPFADPSVVKHVFNDDSVITHQLAMKKVVDSINEQLDDRARHVFVGHAFVTKNGESEENTSDSERPLAIGGAEYVSARLFEPFHYTALGHLHQAHFVLDETIRYAGSPLKYSISEERHKKGFSIVQLDGDGNVTIEKRLLTPLHELRTVEGTMADILKLPVSEEYIFVKLLDNTPILLPMEKVRSVFPNAMHIERKITTPTSNVEALTHQKSHKQDDLALFTSFYETMKGHEAEQDTLSLFTEVLHEVMNDEGGRE